MVYSVEELARRVDGEVHGDGTVVIHDALPLEHAGQGHISFLDGEKNLDRLGSFRPSALVIPGGVNGWREHPLIGEGCPVILVGDAFAAFVRIVRLFRSHPAPPPVGVHPTAVVDRGVITGEGCVIGPHAVVGEGTVLGARCVLHAGVVVAQNCRIGDDVVLHPNVVLYDGVILGHRVVVHANSVLGADGFGYRLEQGRHVKVPQLGWVEVGDDVEIGAATTIDRGVFGPTRIGAGTKIDNLVQVGHNNQIGRHNLLVSQVGLAGSCTTGDYVVMAGQAGIADHVHIGDRVVVGAKAGVPRDVAAGQTVFGYPATQAMQQMKMQVALGKLPAMMAEFREVKQRLEQLESAARLREAG